MADKSQKMLARLPRGFADRSAEDIRAVEEMTARIKAVYELYGFEPADQPMIEYTDALGKFLPDQDRPNEGVFSFQDDDEQWLSLRYDLTAPMARFVAENYERLPKPFRSYRSGWVFRNEKPGPGRFRQFMQFDADTVGTPGVAADAEMAMMMADVMEALGIARGDYVVRVNNRKVLDGVLEAIGLGGEENAGRRLTVLRAIDKLDKVGADGVRDLLGKGRLDESGDFTKGAGLDDDQISRVLQYLEMAQVGESVGICAERRAQPLPGADAFAIGHGLGAAEGHMLDEMGIARLVVVLHHRARVHPHADRQAVRRISVLPHRIADAVGQHAEAPGLVDGKIAALEQPWQGRHCGGCRGGGCWLGRRRFRMDRRDQGKDRGGGKEARDGRLHLKIPKGRDRS